MFTGIIEDVGTVVGTDARTDGDTTLRVATSTPDLLVGVAVGDSVAVAGVCLTVVDHDATTFSVVAVPETLTRTTLGRLGVGEAVNLERAMAASGRFDGHIVQGHVDGVGSVVAVVEEGGGRRLTISAPDDLGRYLVEKGSVTVDGTSLTVAAIHGADFAIAVIPHTLAVTTLGRLRPGDPVNLEVDIIAKYVERLTRP